MVLQLGELTALPGSAHAVSTIEAPVLLGGAASRTGRCLQLTGAAAIIRATPGRYLVTAGAAPVTVSMGRFSSVYPIALTTIPAQSAVIVAVRSDRANQIPWRMMLSGFGAHACLTDP